MTEAEILRRAAARAAAREPFVLATVVGTRRSAPRDAGAKMLVLADGRIEGTIGGGPLEAAVIVEAKRRLSGADGSALLAFEMDATGDEAAALVPTSDFSGAGAKASFAGERRGAEPRPAFFKGGAGGYTSDQLGMKCGGEADVFVDVVRPPPRIVIFGAGHVGEKVAAVAGAADLAHVVVDDRAELARAERFPGAAGVVCADLKRDPLGGISLGVNDLAVIVTRCHAIDELVFEAAVRSTARYVGLIGSRRKIGLICKALESRGLDPRGDPRVHAPIGLDIGGKEPGQIAVAIVAELLAALGGTLTHRSLGPHKLKAVERG